MKIPFSKYHGTGNDFVLIDNRSQILRGDEHEAFAAICHRRFGIGADGVILLNAHDGYDFEMDYFNADGNRSSMCGNGGRCTVQFAHDLQLIDTQAHFLAVDGPHLAYIVDGAIKLKMGMPHDFQLLPTGDYFIHTGSPHLVHFLTSALDQFDVVGQGRAIRNSDRWAAEGTNVNFVQILDQGRAAVRTYERGVEDETWSCGTGVTAVAEIMKRTSSNLPDVILLETPGGELRVHLSPDEAPWLEGPAKFVFKGTIEISTHA